MSFFCNVLWLTSWVFIGQAVCCALVAFRLCK